MDKTKEEKLLEVAENVPKVYESGVREGKKAEWSDFWDVFQNYGDEAGQNYNNAFSYERFTDAIYKPKYPIITTTSSTAAQTIFIYSIITDTKVPIKCQGNRMNQTFASSSIQKIPELNVHENVVFDRAFVSASNLEELNMTGTIGQNGFNVQWSAKLTHDSLMSIINALADKTADTSGTEWIVTVGTTNVTKLTADELSIASNKGWQVK